jgi:hypothetical protein
MGKNVVRQPSTFELGLINRHFAKKELKVEDVYILDIDAADSTTLTAYHSRLGEDMVRGFYADVTSRHTNPQAEIVGFLLGHDKSKIPIGTLFNANLVEDRSTTPGKLSFKPMVHMVKGLQATDEYVKSLEAGHTEAVSVGFQAGSYLCDLCGNDVRGWNCDHMPGAEYNMAKDGEPPMIKTATYTVHQGKVKSRNLIELSGVYAGAMPGKRVQGEFSIPDNSTLKVTGGKLVDEKGTIFASTNIKDFKPDDILRFNYAFDGSIEKVGENMTAKEQQELVRNLSLSEQDKVTLSNQLEVANKKIQKLEVEKQGFKEIADAYRKDLVEKCRKRSVGIFGTKFDEKLFAKEVQGLEMEELKSKLDFLEGLLASGLSIGGRKSKQTDQVHGLGKRETKVEQDNEAYKIK